MSTARSQQIITLANLSIPSDSAALAKKIIWKDFGVYLDKKIDTHTTREPHISALTHDSAPHSSYLALVPKYRICTSCERPIGEQSLASHYAACVAMKQKKRALEAANGTAGAGQPKRKRARALDDLSVESSRNTTPVPSASGAGAAAGTLNGITVTADGTVRPKKKYKKSKTQREKEAANAAAAAAAPAAAASSRGGGAKLSLKHLLADAPGADDGFYGDAGGAAAAAPAAAKSSAKKLKLKAQAKLKGPVDVEKQCGVPLPSGGFCARLLTCKTHSMGAKRAVLGRSAPYDVLLQQYQKRNQAKLAANNALAAQRRENAAFTGTTKADDYLDGASMANKVLDPDEETHLVLEGLSKNHPVPLERKVMMPARNRHRFLYMREAYANALIVGGAAGAGAAAAGGGQRLALGLVLGAAGAAAAAAPADQTLANQAILGSIGGLQGRCTLVNVDHSLGYTTEPYQTQAFAAIPGELYQVRAPLKAILMTLQYNAMQQQAFQQQMAKHQQMLLMKRQAQAKQNA
jgi:SAGA-associated factor 73